MSTQLVNLFDEIFCGKSVSKKPKSGKSAQSRRRGFRVLAGEGLERREMMTASTLASALAVPALVGAPTAGATAKDAGGVTILTNTTTSMSALPTTVAQTHAFNVTISVKDNLGPVQGFEGIVRLLDVTDPKNPVAIASSDGALANSSAGTTITVDPNAHRLSVGKHVFQAEFIPNVSSLHVESTSATQAVNVVSSTANTTTTTKIVSSVASPQLGQAQTFTATITPVNSSLGVPTGTVTFVVDGVTKTTVALNSKGSASYASPALAMGNHTITAKYNSNDIRFNSGSAVLNQSVGKISTSDGLFFSANSPTAPVYGQWFGVFARITPASTTAARPTGTVTFTIAGGPTVTENLDQASSTATWLGSSTLAAGAHKITVAYSGDANYAPSTSSGTVTVQQAASTTYLRASTVKAVTGEAVTLTATVAANNPSKGDVKGQVVHFFDNGRELGTATVNANGTASFVTSSLSIGSNAFTASLGANTNFRASTSSPTTINVSKDDTTISISPSANPAVLGQALSFKLTVAAHKPGGGTPGGEVTLLADGVIVGTGNLNAFGQATVALNKTLSVGSHKITAEYEGDTRFYQTYSSIGETINRAATQTSLTSSTKGNTSAYGAPVTFTATVKVLAPGAGQLTSGTVIFKDINTNQILATVSLTPTGNGVATYTTSALNAGTHVIIASYQGITNLAASAGQVNYSVVKSATVTSLTATPSGTTVGSMVSFTVTVQSNPNRGTPTGTVTFKDGNTVLGTATLANGKATLKTSRLVAGNNKITATFAGSANFITSSATINVTEK